MFKHKNIRLSRTNYLGQHFYFITICCFRRRQILGDPAHCSSRLEILQSESATRNFAIHAYCVMPDHFHFLAEGLSLSSDMLNLVLTLKLKTSRMYRQRISEPLWQKKFFDHILRAADSPEQIAWYIWLNSVRKKLCSDPNAYPYSGAFTTSIPRLHPSTATWQPPWKQAADAPEQLVALVVPL